MKKTVTIELDAYAVSRIKKSGEPIEDFIIAAIKARVKERCPE